ncbi:MAG: c-di-GMP-binding flagellar brake protein YcgR [Gammaproteobacteria bacterium]|jgi:c-di-GMP-binding flagellar brake protein YcgR
MSTERRKYFRIQDNALVKYRVVQSDKLEAERHAVHLSQIKAENTRAALFGLETHLQEVFDKVRHSNPPIVEALELINRKINLLERIVSVEHTAPGSEEYHEHEPKEINLSGGGMAITAVCVLAVGTNLAIDLVLLPSNDPMRIFGRVVSTRKIDGDQHVISIVFEEIRPDDQDRLIQHILRRQSEQLRLARQTATG